MARNSHPDDLAATLSALGGLRRSPAGFEFDFTPPVPCGVGDWHLTSLRRTERQSWEVGFESASNPRHCLQLCSLGKLLTDHFLTGRPVVSMSGEMFPNAPRVSVVGKSSAITTVRVAAGSFNLTPMVELNADIKIWLFDFIDPARPYPISSVVHETPSPDIDAMKRVCVDAGKLVADFFLALDANAFPWAHIPELTAARAEFLPATPRAKTTAVQNVTKARTF